MPTRLLAAWGDSETIGYHAANFAKAEVILYGGVENFNTNTILELTTDPDVPFFDVTAVREGTESFVFRVVFFSLCVGVHPVHPEGATMIISYRTTVFLRPTCICPTSDTVTGW